MPIASRWRSPASSRGHRHHRPAEPAGGQGKKGEEAPAGQFLHVGIAQRGFERRFELADYVRVDDANLEDGLLTIDLVREVPEAMKPKKIAVGTQKTLSVVHDAGKDAAPDSAAA
jgi:molecular chaperone IbpA